MKLGTANKSSDVALSFLKIEFNTDRMISPKINFCQDTYGKN